MRALMARTCGGPEVLGIAEIGPPVPLQDQLLVGVEYPGLNFSDVDHRRGERGTPLPMVMGTEGSGQVVAPGARTERFANGDRVRLVAAGYARQLRGVGGDSGRARFASRTGPTPKSRSR